MGMTLRNIFIQLLYSVLTLIKFSPLSALIRFRKTFQWSSTYLIVCNKFFLLGHSVLYPCVRLVSGSR